MALRGVLTTGLALFPGAPRPQHITIMMDRYAHLFAGHDDEVMEAFDAAITGATPPTNVTPLGA